MSPHRIAAAVRTWTLVQSGEVALARRALCLGPRIRDYEDPEAWLRVVAYRITVNSWHKARNIAQIAGHREYLADKPA